jgi:hypothetical protein
MAKKNLISATLNDADRDAAKAAIATAKGKMPFLITLSDEERRKSYKMGQKSVEYVRLNLRGAKNFPQYLLASFDTAEYEKDVNLISQLWEVRIVIASLLEAVDDTIMAAGIDGIDSASVVYDYLKKAAKKDAAVKSLLDEIGKRFVAQRVGGKTKKTATVTK